MKTKDNKIFELLEKKHGEIVTIKKKYENTIKTSRSISAYLKSLAVSDEGDKLIREDNTYEWYSTLIY